MLLVDINLTLMTHDLIGHKLEKLLGVIIEGGSKMKSYDWDGVDNEKGLREEEVSDNCFAVIATKSGLFHSS